MEKLLEIRKFKERERSLELAEVTGRYMKKENEIKHLLSMRKQILKNRFNYADKNITADSVFYDTQISAVREKIMHLEKELEEIEKERKSVRGRYIEALRDKNVLEKLKEKKMAEHKKSEMGKEEKALDDIAVTSFTIKLQEVQ
jgi:flagellar FliJ protein